MWHTNYVIRGSALPFPTDCCDLPDWTRQVIRGLRCKMCACHHVVLNLLFRSSSQSMFRLLPSKAAPCSPRGVAPPGPSQSSATRPRRRCCERSPCRHACQRHIGASTCEDGATQGEEASCVPLHWTVRWNTRQVFTKSLTPPRSRNNNLIQVCVCVCVCF